MTRLSKKEAMSLLDRMPPDIADWLRESKGMANPAKGESDNTKKNKKRSKSVSEGMAQADIRVSVDEEHFGFIAHGVSLYTLNEIVSILQNPKRIGVIFSYKEKCRKIVNNALLLAGHPSFDSHCVITLFRVGKKKVDRDSLPVMFKFMIDALRGKKNALGKFDNGLISDDNPDIIVDIVIKQSIGSPAIGIRVDRLPDYVSEDPDIEKIILGKGENL